MALHFSDYVWYYIVLYYFALQYVLAGIFGWAAGGYKNSCVVRVIQGISTKSLKNVDDDKIRKLKNLTPILNNTKMNHK